MAAGYHMLQRVSFETDLAEACRRHNVSLLAYSPLAGEWRACGSTILWCKVVEMGSDVSVINN
jgi:diketogulonate reductase-like aldo/keto reductase